MSKIEHFIRLSVWLEEAIFDKINDSKQANYRTMVRRMTQAIRTKEEQKQEILACTDPDSVNNWAQDFVGQRSGASATKASSGAQETGNADSSNPFGGAEQSAQRNPFAGRGMPMARPRGGPPSSRGRGGPRFPPAPALGRFAAPPMPEPSQQAEEKKQMIESGSADDRSVLI